MKFYRNLKSAYNQTFEEYPDMYHPSYDVMVALGVVANVLMAVGLITIVKKIVKKS